jgi:hypothetical protein
MVFYNKVLSFLRLGARGFERENQIFGERKAIETVTLEPTDCHFVESW